MTIMHSHHFIAILKLRIPCRLINFKLNIETGEKLQMGSKALCGQMDRRTDRVRVDVKLPFHLKLNKFNLEYSRSALLFYGIIKQSFSQ